MREPRTYLLSYRGASAAADQSPDTCDACQGIGFHGCDADCQPGCGGNHACVICSGTGRTPTGATPSADNQLSQRRIG